MNTSKGDASDVGEFSDNSQVTVFEFLESAELAYLGWGNSVEKANQLYNKHLSAHPELLETSLTIYPGNLSQWPAVEEKNVSFILL